MCIIWLVGVTIVVSDSTVKTIWQSAYIGIRTKDIVFCIIDKAVVGVCVVFARNNFWEEVFINKFWDKMSDAGSAVLCVAGSDAYYILSKRYIIDGIVETGWYCLMQ
jgi:hypothetical protein